MTSFIHCSDIHLGCVQYDSIERFNDFGESFSHIVDYAIDNKVQHFLICGDLFNKRNINAMTLMQAMDILGRLQDANINVIAIEGNHDKAFREDKVSWMQFLCEKGYVKLLKPDFKDGDIILDKWEGKGAYFETDDLRIYGLGYLGATTGQRIRQVEPRIIDDGKFTILMLHGAIDSMAKMDIGGVKDEDILVLKDKVDYLALGHLHHRCELQGWAFNPGAPEYWDITEYGYEKGFYHVLIDSGTKDVRFINSKKRDAYRKLIDVSGSKDPSEVEVKVWEQLDVSSLGKMVNPIIQLVLIGKVLFNPIEIDVSVIEDKLKSEYNCLAVEVLNETDLFISRFVGGSVIDRALIERSVILDIVKQSAKFKDISEDITDIAIAVKEMVLSGEEPDEIVDFLHEQVKSVTRGDQDGRSG